MRTRYLLDGNVIEESPKGWDKRVTAIKLDRVLKGRTVLEDTTLTWYADGYRFISNYFNNNIAGELECIIQTDEFHNGVWQTDYIGKLKMGDCEFNLAPNFVKTKIIDDGFYARIDNNRAIKTTVNNTRSKNNVLITEASEKILSLFSDSDGTYGYGGRQGYTIYEAFRYMIAFVSDDEVGFVSETFYDGAVGTGEFANFVLMRGVELRLGTTNTDLYLELDFETLYKEIDKKFNIGYRMEYVNGKPTMRIEKASWFDKDTSGVYFSDVRNLKRSIDRDYAYSAINVGSKKTEDAAGTLFPENTRWFGFHEEQYYLLGNGNTDKVLDLVSDWIIANNVIMDVIGNNNEAYDDDVFIIEVINTIGVGIYAFQSNWFVTGPPFYYNEHLTNEHVIERWLDGIPQSIAAQLGVSNSLFHALRTERRGTYRATVSSPITETMAPVQFEDDYTDPLNFDASNNYGNGTAQGSPVAQADSRFTASSAGLFHIITNAYWRVLHADQNMSLDVTLSIKRYNSSDVLQQTYPVYDFRSHPGTGDYHLRASYVIVMNSGDYVIVERIFHGYWNLPVPFIPPANYIEWRELPDNDFQCVYASIDEGGQYTITDIVNQKFMRYVVTKVPCSEAKAKQMIADTSQPIYINTDGVRNYKGWIDDVKINRDIPGTVDLTIRGRKIDEPKTD